MPGFCGSRTGIFSQVLCGRRFPPGARSPGVSQRARFGTRGGGGVCDGPRGGEYGKGQQIYLVIEAALSQGVGGLRV